MFRIWGSLPLFLRTHADYGGISEHSIPIAIGEPLPACIRDPEISPCESAEAGIRESGRVRLGSKKKVVDLKTRAIRVGDQKGGRYRSGAPFLAPSNAAEVRPRGTMPVAAFYVDVLGFEVKLRSSHVGPAQALLGLVQRQGGTTHNNTHPPRPVAASSAAPTGVSRPLRETGGRGMGMDGDRPDLGGRAAPRGHSA